jgi:type I restriction enzyme, S subunit
MSWKIEKLGNVVTHRKEFITIDNSVEYKRCRVQVNRKGVVLRDIVKGIAINTKKQQVCREGDFLVAEIDAKVGGYAFVPSDLEGAIVSSHYFLFGVDETKLLKDYLAWIIKTDIIQEQITSKGSTNYAAIRPHHVLSFEIPLPSIGEQAVIVHRLNNINEEYYLLDKELDQQQTYLQLLRQTILLEAVQGKLTHQDPTDEPATELLKRIKAEKEKLIKAGKLKKEKELPPITEDEIPFELPEGWLWCRFGDVVEKIGDVDHKMPLEVKDGFPYISPRDFYGVNEIDFNNAKKISKTDFESLSRKIKPEKNDIIFPRYGTIGINRFVVTEIDFLASYSCAVIKTFKKLTSPEFCFLYSLSPLVKDEIKKHVVKTTQPNVGMKSINEFLIPLPPLAEQQRIVAKVQQLQQQLSQLEAQVQQSHQYAQQLLQSVLKEAIQQKAAVYEMEEEVSVVTKGI